MSQNHPDWGGHWRWHLDSGCCGWDCLALQGIHWLFRWWPGDSLAELLYSLHCNSAPPPATVWKEELCLHFLTFRFLTIEAVELIRISQFTDGSISKGFKPCFKTMYHWTEPPKVQNWREQSRKLGSFLAPDDTRSGLGHFGSEFWANRSCPTTCPLLWILCKRPELCISWASRVLRTIDILILNIILFYRVHLCTWKTTVKY